MKKILTILAITIAYNAYSQDYIGNSFTARTKMKSPVYYIGTDTAAGRDWVRAYHTSHTSPPNTYTAGFGLGLNGFQFYNSRYWKGQDSLSTSLNGLVLSTAGKLTAITDNSTSWNTAYGWGNHAGLYMNKADSLFLNTIPKNSTSANGLRKDGFHRLTLDSANATYGGIVTPFQFNKWNAKQSAITPQSVSAGSNKITLGGTYTGAALQAFSVDINQSNIDHNSLLNYNSYRHFKKTDTDSLSASIPYSNAFSKFVMTDSVTGKLYRMKLTFGSGLTKTTSTVTNDLITGKAGGQTVIGGTGVSDYLTYKSTTGVGTATGIAHTFVGGTNGGTTIMTMLNNGNVGIKTAASETVGITLGGTMSSIYNITAGSVYASTANGLQGNQLRTYSFNTNLTINAYTSGYHVVMATNTGKVGIGITSPTSKLHIDDGNATAAYIQGTCGSTTGQLVTDGWWLGHDASGNLELNQKENLSLNLSTRNNNRLHILANGNVGIDTITPAYKLDVNGSMNLMAGNTYKIGGVDISLHDSLIINTTPKGSTSANGLRKDGEQQIVLDSANADYGGCLTKYQYNYLHNLPLLIGYTDNDNTTLGVGTHQSGLYGSYNTHIGNNAGHDNTGGQWNTAVGYDAGAMNTTADYSVSIGSSASAKTTTGSRNVAIGFHALGENQTGSSNVCIGFEAGGYSTKSNRLYINNRSRSTEPGDTTKSLVHGMFDAAAANQKLTVNGRFYANGSFNNGVDAEAGDDYVVAINGVTSLVDGLIIYFKANTANTGACTVNVSGLGVKSLKAFHDQDPPDSYIEAGSYVHAIYDGTNFQLLSPDANP